MNEITRILKQIDRGDELATNRLLPLVYDELKSLAARRLATEKPGHTLQVTALVHEAYLRLLDGGKSDDWKSRGHFFGAAAEAMRRILVEQARRKLAQKRGGDGKRVALELEQLCGKDHDERVLALNDALAKLEAQDELKAKVVKLRFFAGMTVDETATALAISTSSVDRYWNYARAWLQCEMSSDS